MYQNGTFTTIPNGPIPGSRIKVVAQARATAAVSSRGICAVPLCLDWGADEDVKIFQARDYTRDSLYTFGYEVGDKRLRNVAELFLGATEVVAVRLNAGGEKATCKFGEAKYQGIRGNDLTIGVEADPDAGVLYHELKDTSASFSADNNKLTINFLNVPEGYTLDGELLKDETPVDKQKYSNILGDKVINVNLQPDLESGTYTYKAKLIKGESINIISTGSFTFTHTDAQETTLKVEKGSDEKGTASDEEVTSVTVTWEAVEGGVKATFSEVPDQWTIKPVIKKDSQDASVDGDLIKKVDGEKDFTFTFKKGAEIGEYKIEAHLTKTEGEKDEQISVCTVTLSLEGEDVEESVSAAYDSKKDEDYSKETPARYIVHTYLEGNEIDKQYASDIGELSDNDFIIWNKEARLEETAGEILSGGSNGEVTVKEWTDALNKFEPELFHVLACPSNDEEIKQMYVNFTIKMRETYGYKFQTVLPKMQNSPNYEGIIEVGNKVKDLDAEDPDTALVYWVAGQEAGCEIQTSIGNKDYTGSYDIIMPQTQRDLEKALNDGVLTFHRVRGMDRQPYSRILLDINSLTKPSSTQAASWSRNQTVRVCDYICNYVASLFNNNYIENYNNDLKTRERFQNDLIQFFSDLETIGAIKEFDKESVIVEEGPEYNIIVVQVAITPNNSLEQLYMTVVCV